VASRSEDLGDGGGFNAAFDRPDRHDDDVVANAFTMHVSISYKTLTFVFMLFGILSRIIDSISRHIHL